MDERMERGWSRETRWMWAERMDRYRKVKTGTGRTYRVRMSAEEIEGRRLMGLTVALLVIVPAGIAVMAWAAGLI